MAATHLHFDCFSGISGDMTLGALVDLGAPIEEIERRLKSLPIGPFALRAERIKRQGIMGTKVHVEVEEEHHVHRHLHHIVKIVEEAGLPPRVAERAKKAYHRLAEAEAHVHGSTIEKIHFHEVGAKDAILDVAGAMTAIDLLGVETFSTGPIIVGTGTVQCHHGLMPVPAPATAELLKGLPQVPGDIEFELVTPTGAAILSTLITEPASANIKADGGLVAERIGYGGGDKDFPNRPNFLRVLLCESPQKTSAAALPIRRQTILILETEVDDMSPELAGYMMDRLFIEGALDVQFSPVQMKKNRPGLRLRVLCDPSNEQTIVERIFRETSTFGVRRQLSERWCLERRAEQIETPLGKVGVKVGLWGDAVLKASPEYEDCRALAEAHQKPLAEVYELARAAIRERYGSVIN